MEASSSSSTNISNSGNSSSSSGLTFKVHPLVIVNISDHYTRVNSQLMMNNNNSNDNNNNSKSRVYGCVIGVQKGRTVEIFNSFDLLFDPFSLSFDRPFLLKKLELCMSQLQLSLDSFSNYF